ncbi:MAG: hypothetical protein CMC82_00280 [Flavobacteriaceae bacterium]|nr:hypothetical protein [Flavobacteriaceae bacterium]|tara:strand:+ start:1458 stop:1775 length:318 start_codon:yes stop_codon:yes gene_type:complete
MFKEEITKEGDIYTVTVSIEERKYAIEDKLIYQGNPFNLVPAEDRKYLVILKTPKKKISNMKKEKFQNLGVWKFQVVSPPKEKKPVKSKTTTRRRRATQKNTTQK